MGWRDRVKKSFGDSEHIGHRVENLKNKKKERKEGLKMIFRGYAHNPQNPQNRAEQKPDAHGLRFEYEQLWAQAWALADFVEGNTALYEERIKRLPELLNMRDRLAVLELNINAGKF